MPIQKQEDAMFASEPEAPSGNPPWHEPVLNVYNAEDAEHGIVISSSDATAFAS